MGIVFQFMTEIVNADVLNVQALNASEQAASDEKWMQLALDYAKKSAEEGEVPVGAVLVRHNDLLAVAGNRPIIECDPTGHAEIRVLRAAALKDANYRLPGTTLYVTLEPCTMCVGAIVHARVNRVVFGAREPKAGAIVSQNNLLNHSAMNTLVSFSEGVLADECSAVLTVFFEMRREQKRLLKNELKSVLDEKKIKNI
ncbi:MAG: tRNA(adenine34) deaminase [Oleiphilaceae bacterium]|jgi:tRNA(adenine34) deaminase